MFVFIIDADPSAPVSYWNKTWLQYTGQTLEEASGRAWNGIIHPDDIPIVMEHYAPAFESRTSYFIPAVRVKRHDDVYRWHSFKGNPRFLPNGAFDGYVGVGFDVHEQKITEEKLEDIVAERTAELQGINKELQRSNQNLEEFAHAASHDLKEPIRKIHFFTDQLRSQLSERLNESEKHTFNRIENASKRMGALIDDLLLFSHVSSKPHAKEVVDLNERVKRVLEDLELEVQLKSATITINPCLL
jgi:PAS domain S-box-containing protein